MKSVLQIKQGVEKDKEFEILQKLVNILLRGDLFVNDVDTP